jgi:hypothetical protein
VKLGDSIPHMVLVAGKGLKCHCGQPASRFILCLHCQEIVASCGGHKLTIEQEREAHCRVAP